MMKKKNLKSLTLNKKIISEFNSLKAKGGLETHEINCHNTNPTADSYNVCVEPTVVPCEDLTMFYTYRPVDCVDTKPKR